MSHDKYTWTDAGMRRDPDGNWCLSAQLDAVLARAVELDERNAVLENENEALRIGYVHIREYAANKLEP
jgi:hypothetical protein